MSKVTAAEDPHKLADLAASQILAKSGLDRFDIAITLGSGWGQAADYLGETVASLPSSDIPGFSVSGIPGHSGTLRAVTMQNGLNALLIGARTHLYEGKGVRSVVHSVRSAAACGAETMVLTNGAGGIKGTFSPGQPVLISDHINLTGETPLEGANFVDLTDLYSSKLREVARAANSSLDEGVYVQFRGPNYETAAEVQMAKTMGGHIVGMSTALEAIAAREAKMEVLAFSLITNMAAGISPNPLSHEEVISIGKAAEPTLSKLLAETILAL
mgnify:CR=1 FL=1